MFVSVVAHMSLETIQNETFLASPYHIPDFYGFTSAEDCLRQCSISMQCLASDYYFKNQTCRLYKTKDVYDFQFHVKFEKANDTSDFNEFSWKSWQRGIYLNKHMY